jgi:flagellar hook-associated protein 3 FlgL
MRIAFQTGFRDAIADIQRTSEQMATAQRQVSTGRRLDVPSDDPSATTGAIGERASMGTIDRYVRSADSATSRLSIVDTVLSEIVSKLSAAQTAAASAIGDTASPEQRTAAVDELASIRDQLVEDLNTKVGGVFVFAGTASTTKPFTQNPNGTVNAYQGNASTVNVDIDRAKSVQATFDGQALTQGSDSTDIFTAIENLRTAILANDTPNIENGLAAMKRGFDRATGMQSQVGSGEKALEEQRSRLSTQRLGVKARLSKFEDADMSEAISAMNRAEIGYRAALGAAATIRRVSLLDYLK